MKDLAMTIESFNKELERVIANIYEALRVKTD